MKGKPQDMGKGVFEGKENKSLTIVSVSIPLLFLMCNNAVAVSFLDYASRSWLDSMESFLACVGIGSNRNELGCRYKYGLEKMTLKLANCTIYTC